MPNWIDVHGTEYAVPEEVLELLARGRGLLVDASYGNDVCPRFARHYPRIGPEVWLNLWVEHPLPERRESPGARFLVEIVPEGHALPRHEVLATDDAGEAVRAVVWADLIIASRFAALMDLWQKNIIPHCVNCCGDLHNFLDWNVAGDVEQVLAAAERELGDPAAALDRICGIINAVDELLNGWLGRHAEPDLPAEATLEQMARLLCSHNPRIEQQVSERFLQLDHQSVRQFLHHAAGPDGSNLGVKVMALVRAANRAGRSRAG
jgi:hypothetical protein